MKPEEPEKPHPDKAQFNRREFLQALGGAWDIVHHIDKLGDSLTTPQAENVPPHVMAMLQERLAWEASKTPEECFREESFAVPLDSQRGFAPMLRLFESLAQWRHRGELSAGAPERAIGTYVAAEGRRHYEHSKAAFEERFHDPDYADIAKKVFPDGFPSYRDFLREDLQVCLTEASPDQQRVLQACMERVLDKVAPLSISDTKKQKSFAERAVHELQKVSCPDRM